MPRLFLACCLAVAVAATPADPPSGWRYPTERDYRDDWAEFRKELPVPFHARADFNGDGLEDEAWILLATRGQAWGLFVFVAQKSGRPMVLQLDEDRGQGRAQWMGIAAIPPGEYRTACGKGYFDCEPGEPEVLRLTRPALDYFRFESANSFFWWDPKTRSFKRTWMSD